MERDGKDPGKASQAVARRAAWWPAARAALVWLGVLGGVLWLYRNGAGGADAPALAEARDHKVSVTEPGTVRAVEVQPGQRVRQGEVLVRLSTADIDAQIEVLRAEIGRIRSTVEAGASTSASSAFNDDRSLSDELQAARQAEIEARGAKARDAAELSELERELAQEQDLVNRGLVRNDRVQALNARLGPLRESVAGDEARLATAQLRRELAAQRLARWRQQFGPASAGQAVSVQVRPLQEAVLAKDAELKMLLERRERLTVTAPVDGHVTAVNARPGDVVRAGDPALVVTGLVPQQVVAYVIERHRLHLQAGQRVVIQGGSRAPIEGRVRSVSGAVTQLPGRLWSSMQAAPWGREVYIDVPADVGLHPGEQLEVRFMEPPLPELPPRLAQAASSATP